MLLSGRKGCALLQMDRLATPAHRDTGEAGCWSTDGVECEPRKVLLCVLVSSEKEDTHQFPNSATAECQAPCGCVAHGSPEKEHL